MSACGIHPSLRGGLTRFGRLRAVCIAVADAFPDLPDGSIDQGRGFTRMTAVIPGLIGDADFGSSVLECRKRRIHMRSPTSK